MKRIVKYFQNNRERNYVPRSDYTYDVYNSIHDFYEGADVAFIDVERLLSGGTDCIEVQFNSDFTDAEYDELLTYLKSEGLHSWVSKIEKFRNGFYLYVKHSYVTKKSSIVTCSVFDDFGSNELKIDPNVADLEMLEYLHSSLIEYLSENNLTPAECSISGYVGLSNHNDEFIMLTPGGRRHTVPYVGSSYRGSVDTYGELTYDVIDFALAQARK